MERRWHVIVALVADLLGLAWVALLPPLALRLGRFAFSNSILLGAFFLFFLLGIYVLKRLRPAPWLRARPFQVLAALFAFVLANAVAYSVGFLDSVAALNRQTLDEPAAALYLLLTPASWLALSLIYLLMLSLEAEPAAWSERRRPVLALSALLAINLMALALAAVTRALWFRFSAEPSWLLLPVTWLLLLLLFLPPRLLYLGRQPARHALSAWLSFLLYLGALSWAALFA